MITRTQESKRALPGHPWLGGKQQLTHKQLPSFPPLPLLSSSGQAALSWRRGAGTQWGLNCVFSTSPETFIQGVYSLCTTPKGHRQITSHATPPPAKPYANLTNGNFVFGAFHLLLRISLTFHLPVLIPSGGVTKTPLSPCPQAPIL